MVRWVPLVGLMFLLSACDTAGGIGAAVSQSVSPTVPTDPARDTFGVSAPAEGGEAEASQGLDWKVGQLCTNGADTQQQGMLPAEDGKQFASRTLTCRAYHLSL